MNKVASSFLSAALLTLPLMAQAGDENRSVEAVQEQVSQLQSAQDSNDKQFDKAYDEIKKVEQQLPKLNEKLQAQLKKLQKNNNKMIKEVKEANEEQINALTEQLNKLKERLSKKVSEEG